MGFYKRKECHLAPAERWLNSWLVTFPVSYRYNGGIVIDDEWYEGYEVPSPKVPEGFTLESIGCGLQLNAHPPYATMYLKPKDGRKFSKRELRKVLAEV